MSSQASFHYLPVSDRMRAWDLYVTGVGRQTYAAGALYPEAGHPAMYDFRWSAGRVLPEYALVLILAGCGEFEVRGQPRQDCAAGDVLMFSPGQWHRYRPKPDTGWTELWLCTGGEYLHRLRSRGLAFNAARVDLGAMFDAVRAVALGILDEVEHAPDRNHPALTAKGMEAIALVAEAAAGHETTAARGDSAAPLEPSIVPALEYIWANSHRRLCIAEIARAVGLQTRTLERRFARGHVRTVHEEIEYSRYVHARHLLERSELPIKEIAYSCGFGDPRRMIDVFRRRDGRPPGALRRRDGAAKDRCSG